MSDAMYVNSSTYSTINKLCLWVLKYVTLNFRCFGRLLLPSALVTLSYRRSLSFSKRKKKFFKARVESSRVESLNNLIDVAFFFKEKKIVKSKHHQKKKIEIAKSDSPSIFRIGHMDIAGVKIVACP